MFQDYITTEFIDWLDSKSLFYKKVSDNMHLIYNSDYCIKIYDRIGHGFGINVNLSQDFNETIYDGDTCSAFWVYRYLGLREQSNFSRRSITDYEFNLPLLIIDLKNLIGAIEEKDRFWDDATKWINEESLKEFKTR